MYSKFIQILLKVLKRLLSVKTNNQIKFFFGGGGGVLHFFKYSVNSSCTSFNIHYASFICATCFKFTQTQTLHADVNIRFIFIKIKIFLLSNEYYISALFS